DHLGDAPRLAQALDGHHLHHRPGEHVLEMLADRGEGGPGDDDPGRLHRPIRAGHAAEPRSHARNTIAPMGGSARGRAAAALGVGAVLLALAWRMSPLPSPPMYEGQTAPAQPYR